MNSTALKNQNIKKKLNMDKKTIKQIQKVTCLLLIKTLILTIITSAQNMKFPSKLSPPIYPNYSMPESRVIKHTAHKKTPCQTA